MSLHGELFTTSVKKLTNALPYNQILVTCQERDVSHIRAIISERVMFELSWPRFCEMASFAKCSVIVRDDLDTKGVELQHLKAFNVPQLIICANPTVTIINALSGVGFAQFVPFDELTYKLDRAIRSVMQATICRSTYQLLVSFHSSMEVRRALQVLFCDSTIAGSDEAVAREAELGLNTLRYRCRRDMGVTLSELRRYARLARSLDMKSKGVSQAVAAYELGIEASTLSRDARRLTGRNYRDITQEVLLQVLLNRTRNARR